MQTALPQIFATISCNFFYFLHDRHQNHILQFFLYFTSSSPTPILIGKHCQEHKKKKVKHFNNNLQLFLISTWSSLKLYLEIFLYSTSSSPTPISIGKQCQGNKNKKGKFVNNYLQLFQFSTSLSPSLTLIGNLECRLLKSHSPIKSCRVFPIGTRTLSFLSIVLTT